MPSESQKLREKKKKEAARQKDVTKKKVDANAPANGASNGVANGASNGACADAPKISNGACANPVQVITEEMNDLDLAGQYRAVTGSLSSHPDGRDVHIINFSITFHGAELLQDTKLELNNGRRYGLLGLNGDGKSSLMSALGNREAPIPSHIDIFHLTREMAPSEKTALECVMEVDQERVRLEREAEELAVKDSEEAHERLIDVYERLDEMDADTAGVRAGEILFGLGFSRKMQNQKVKTFSGGWRMRIALARALFVKPDMMLLDEPTNHLDLDACVWLEKYLQTYTRILVIISHSQDFLNGVCTNIIHIHKKKLKYYGGNYDSYVQTRMELEENQMKKFRWEQDQIAHMKNYIARFGHGSAKLARQAKSKEKTLGKMIDGGLADKVSTDRVVTFYFPECGTLPPPVIQIQNVSFRYKDDGPLIYKDLEFGVDLDSRIALVGPNGAGKSTLIKLIAGELIATDGLIRRHSHLRFGRYHQHLAELLDMDMTAIDWMMQKFPAFKERDDMRKIIGKYGLSGQQQTSPIRNLSDGQRCRIIFCYISWNAPHMLLLDEPTNHLDMETIDALADAINEFQGGLLLVSHDFRLISQVAEEIWVCNNATVTKWNGTIFDYKEAIMKKLDKEQKKREKV